MPNRPHSPRARRRAQPTRRYARPAPGGAIRTDAAEVTAHVIDAANAMGARWYKPRRLPPYPDYATYLRALEANKRWIHDRIREGYEFYTIGIDRRRTTRGVFYKAELEVLAKRGITPKLLPWTRK